MLLLGLKERGFTVWGDRELWQFPTWFYPTLGWIALFVSGFMILAGVVKPIRDRLHLEDVLGDAPPRSMRQNTVRQINWIVLLTVYLCGFIGALSAISPKSATFDVVFWFGFALFFILLAAWIRSPSFRRAKVVEDDKTHEEPTIPASTSE